VARYSKTLTPQAQAAFVAALRGGALVVAAAAQAGVALSSLYCRRARDPAFAAAWAAAVEASTPLWRGRAPSAGTNPARRARLAGWRRDAFLAGLADTCHIADSAAAAGIDKATVYRLIRRDPGFARDCAAAVARGTPLLFERQAREREAAAARARAGGLVPTGRPTADFDEAMKLMARWERRDGSLGRRFVRHGRMKRLPFDEAIKLLARRLRGLGFGPAEPAK
jgi:hypothetical protein